MKLLQLLVLPAMLSLPATLVPATPLTHTIAACIAQDDAPSKIERGNVTKIDAAAKTFSIKSSAEGAKDVNVTWNDATVFMLDGRVVKWDEVVKENANLTVTHKKGVATKVEGMNKH